MRHVICMNECVRACVCVCIHNNQQMACSSFRQVCRSSRVFAPAMPATLTVAHSNPVATNPALAPSCFLLPSRAPSSARRLSTSAWTDSSPSSSFASMGLRASSQFAAGVPKRAHSSTSSSSLPSAPSPSTADPQELAKFTSIAKEWWDPFGKFQPLHAMNPIRLEYIRRMVADVRQQHPDAQNPLEGLSVLDIGCGGGILSEALARLGANVTGADAGELNIHIARAHAESNPSVSNKIKYLTTTAEELAEKGSQFDAVFAMEILEHVADVSAFVKACSSLVKPGGLVFFSTINHTPLAYGLTIFAAEQLLRWVPPGTHEFSKYVAPRDLRLVSESHGLRVCDMTGAVFDPLQRRWHLRSDLSVNYFATAIRA